MLDLVLPEALGLALSRVQVLVAGSLSDCLAWRLSEALRVSTSVMFYPPQAGVDYIFKRANGLLLRICCSRAERRDWQSRHRDSGKCGTLGDETAIRRPPDDAPNVGDSWCDGMWVAGVFEPMRSAMHVRPLKRGS